MSEVLNIDEPESWIEDFSNLVFYDPTWSEVSEKIQNVEMDAINFYAQLDCDPKYLSDPLAQRLRHEASKILEEKYEYVLACHGCRINDVDSYRTHGIRLSEPDTLVQLAYKLFDGIPGIDAAVRNLNMGGQYFEHNNGKIGFLLSRKNAVFTKNDYCTGSELIAGLAHRLGVEAEKRWSEYGAPSFIVCKIPLPWLDEHTTFPVRHSYSDAILKVLVQSRADDEFQYRGVNGGFLLTTPVDAENIIEIVDMSHVER